MRLPLGMRRLVVGCALSALAALPAAAGAHWWPADAPTPAAHSRLAVPALAAPVLPLSHSGRWITDALGRVVVVHGTNMVYKLPPYYPAAAGFGPSDAAFLRSIGFNAVRVGVIWKALEPEPGVYDDAYLDHIVQTVDMLGRYGIVSLLDFHQDMYNEQFQGEGAPDWAVQTGGLPNPKLGFPGNYLGNPALEHALDAFFDNAPGPGGIGLDVRFASAWAHAARLFRNDRWVVGYELFNEPFPGTTWESCANPVGCPFDATLTRLYLRVDAAIRALDRRTLIFYEPNVLFNDGAGTEVGPIGDSRAGFAFHDYCLTQPATGTSEPCTVADNLVFSHALAHVASTGDALLMTEFGATQNTAYLTEMVQRADSNMVPWMEWAFCGCGDPTTSGPGAQQAIVIDPSKPATGSNLVMPTLDALVEPYPQVIAGTPTGWGFDRATGTFQLSYWTRRVSGAGSFAAGAVTGVFVPALDYPRGYGARVAGGAIVSRPNARLLEIAACRRTATITVTVTPGGGSSGSCRARLRLRVSPRRFVPERPTTIRALVVAVLGSLRAAVAGVDVVLDGQRVRTGPDGRAKLRVRLRDRRYRVSARAPGFITGHTRLRPSP
jgi:endoglycosylceramidase